MGWTQNGNIRGASGIPGASGTPGASGASGAQGASGGTGGVGATGPVGATGAAGTTTWSGITDKPAVIAAGVDAAAARNVISAEYTGNKGQPSGYAALDASGLVPSSQLPSFVDDVVEAANLAAFPATGESGKIYTALDTNKVYRWGGSSYVEISASPGSTDAVPEGSTNLYYTAARADGRITAAVGSTVQAYSPTLTTYAGKSAPSGAVVGTTDAQALTNKTISGANNTVTNLGVAAIGASGTASSSTFLRGDGTWSAPPAGIQRVVQTITSHNTALGSAANTDYVAFLALPSGDANIASVSSILSLNGANGSTTITDTSPTPKTWTATGATLTTAQKKFGTASLSIGNSASIAATSSAFATGTGDFTWEMWAYQTSHTSPQETYFVQDNALGVIFYVRNGYLAWYSSATGVVTSASTVPLNAWYHVALTKSGSTIRGFVNGTQFLSFTFSGNFNGTTLTIGGADASGAAVLVDEVRISNIARYTTNFTAPSDVFPTFGPGLPGAILPTAVGNTNHYTLKNISSASITPATTSSQTVDGTTPAAITAGSTVRYVSDGSNWRTV